MLYPNGYLLLPDIYRAIFERIGARTIGATKIFPGDFHVSRPAYRPSFGSSYLLARAYRGLLVQRRKPLTVKRASGRTLQTSISSCLMVIVPPLN